MKLLIPIEPSMIGSKLIALYIDRQPVLDYEEEIHGEKERKMVLNVKGLYTKGTHTLELLMDKGSYRKYMFEI
ncbi:MAG: hypothetical protein QXR57_03375 [Metallosphaera sp.]|uniref:Uncharacterized protein n=1 Tax=Metallosphaera cuprina (strain Ar-4) TaxID=1006006 RepID=F4FYH7_METCR|nr:hypothetical protein [Metallosphaera cuprina]AEB95475.1 hypothetical protein Mcup_1372 [Metallosphaera cuprina Ar-4]